ncbi:rootletin [Aplysia californica]|uniref:Rootletin n=1 Tax=Aplysia californica TaxID=6500 RepID=A0ABM0JPS0_APLCA|nr:rootletin [Aplysia californica]
MLSSLSRGYGTWHGLLADPSSESNHSLPSLESQKTIHRHGVTVTPRAKTVPTPIPVTDDGQLHIPKTYLTRKGALVLFTGPERVPQEAKKTPRVQKKKQRHKDVLDLSLKLKTMERLSLSVLQFGDKDYNKEVSSISDKENSLFFDFMHELDPERDSDLHSQPGGDLKFYLRDLKRRASGRGFGTGDASPHRARSAELQEILDQLEQAWPRYVNSSAGESFSHLSVGGAGGGGAGGGDSSFRQSPTPSTGSLTRSRLSVKKLTASLKSLDYLGRPASTDPDNVSVISESARSATEFRYGRTRSARSVWMTDSSSPSQLQVRPKTSHFGGRGSLLKPHLDGRLVTSPVHGSREDLTDSARPMWVDIEGQGDTSFISDDIQSQVSGIDLDVRTLERGRAHTPSSQRSRTPSRGDRSGERDAMLAEAASVLSSLVEEEDMDHLLDNLSDEEEAMEDGAQWPGKEQGQTGRMSSMSSRSKTPLPRVDEANQTEEMEDAVAQPLQPPYSGVMRREDGLTTPSGEGQEDELLARISPQGSRPESRAGASRPGSVEPSSTLRVATPTDAQTLLRAGSVSPTAASRGGTPAALSGHPEDLIEEVSSVLPDSGVMRVSSRIGSASVGSADRPAPDPDTLVSLHKDQIMSPEPTRGRVGEKAVDSPVLPLLKEPAPSEPSLKETSPEPRKPAPTTDGKEKVQEMPSQEAKVAERKVGAKSPRSQKVEEEVKTEEVKEDEVKAEGEQEEEKKSTGLSERVIREKEEKARKAAELKEMKEKEEALKREEEEKKKQSAEDKRRAAEERLKLRAEELARQKEEQELQEQSGLVVKEESEETPNASSSRAKKGKKKESKASKPSADAGKKYVNSLDISSVQPDGKAMDALDKLKEANKDDLPVEKIQQWMASQGPPAKVEAEKKEVEVPGHLKEMFERKTEHQAQQELDEEIGKMREAMDEVLGGSVVQSEGTEGLSAEDFELAQQALMEKIKKAEEKIEEAVSPRPVVKKKTPPPVKPGKNEKKSPVTKKKKGVEEAEKKKDLTKEREAIKEQQRLEKQKRLEEVRELQHKIKSKEDARKQKEAEAKRKAQELAERMEAVRQEEEEIERAEADARAQLAEVRKVQREEREARRKADLEKKKQDAIDKREREKAMIEKARQKEQEMLDRIADSEMARRMKEEEEAKREEEERLAQEKFEAELKAAQQAAEDEEEKLRELERLAEEEAFQRLIDEKEAAEEKRWELEEQSRQLREAEEKARREMLEEEKRLEEERMKHEHEEEARRELERERLRELQRLEEEAREKMRDELEKRRLWAMKRREHNLDARAKLDAMRQSQGVTDPWTFSYFVRWPKESYMRPMGQDPKKQRGPPRPKPSPKTPAPDSSAPATADAAT